MEVQMIIRAVIVASAFLLAGCEGMEVVDNSVDEAIAGATDKACYDGSAPKLERDVNRHTKLADVSITCP